MQFSIQKKNYCGALDFFHSVAILDSGARGVPEVSVSDILRKHKSVLGAVLLVCRHLSHCSARDANFVAGLPYVAGIAALPVL